MSTNRMLAHIISLILLMVSITFITGQLDTLASQPGASDFVIFANNVVPLILVLILVVYLVVIIQMVYKSVR